MSDKLPKGVTHLVLFLFVSIVLFLYAELKGLTFIEACKKLFWVCVSFSIIVIALMELNYLAR